MDTRLLVMGCYALAYAAIGLVMRYDVPSSPELLIPLLLTLSLLTTGMFPLAIKNAFSFLRSQVTRSTRAGWALIMIGLVLMQSTHLSTVYFVYRPGPIPDTTLGDSLSSIGKNGSFIPWTAGQ
jgi:hypothetical protein